MNRSRIVEQMCREPDEESSFYSDTACGDMGVMIYNMPGGSRLRFITLPSSDVVVGWRITSLTRWTPSDDAAVVDADTYNSVSRDPAGTLIEPAPGHDWPAPERAIGSFTGVVLLRLDGHA